MNNKKISNGRATMLMLLMVFATIPLQQQQDRQLMQERDLRVLPEQELREVRLSYVRELDLAIDSLNQILELSAENAYRQRARVEDYIRRVEQLRQNEAIQDNELRSRMETMEMLVEEYQTKIMQSEVAAPGETASRDPIMLPPSNEQPVVDEEAPAAANGGSSGESQVPESPEESMSIDDILASMDLGDIVFNTPDSINYYETAVLQFFLGVETSPEELQELITESGDIETAQVRISDRMEARLTGPNFEITAIRPEVQAVSRLEVTEWRWEVKPVSEGQHRLHLTLSALLEVEGSTTPRTIQTFDKVIVVDVSFGQRVSTFVSDNWQWLWSALLIPVAGWLWQRRKKRKPDDDGNDE